MSKRSFAIIIVLAVAMLTTVSFAVTEDAAAAVKKPAKVSSLKVSKVTYKSVSLKWAKAKYAKKYEIYRSESKKTGYELIGTVKKDTRKFKDGGLKTGTRYWYYVRAVNKSQTGKASSRVTGKPALEVPELAASSTADGVVLEITPVKGAKGYFIYRDGKKLAEQSGLSYLDQDLAVGELHEYSVAAFRIVDEKTKKSAKTEVKTAQREEASVKLSGANKIKSPHYKGKSYTIKGKIISNATIQRVDVGVKYKTEEGKVGSWVGSKVHYKNTSVGAMTFDISGPADNSVKFGTLELGEYYYTINVKLIDGSVWKLRSQSFVVEKAPPEPEIVYPKETTKGAINAVKWATKIANDNSFAYGVGKRAHHGGCYFCGTNVTGIKKAKKGSKWEKTYCCNPFIFAAYAHGAKDPAIKAACKKGKCGGMLTSDWTRYGCFATVGKCKKVKFSKLLPGDVIISDKKVSGQYHHVIMYCGGDKYVEAGWEGWGASTIAVRSGAKSNYKKHYQKYDSCYVMRYTGK